MADAVCGTPHDIETPEIYHFLHPSFVGIDEAAMCKQADSHLALAYLFPICFGRLVISSSLVQISQELLWIIPSSGK